MSAANESAFPTGTHKALGEASMGQVSGGLTKREYFAAKALQGLCANQGWEMNHAPVPTAEEAVRYADALLQELAK